MLLLHISDSRKNTGKVVLLLWAQKKFYLHVYQEKPCDIVKLSTAVVKSVYQEKPCDNLKLSTALVKSMYHEKPCDILKLSTALAKSVYHVTDYSVDNLAISVSAKNNR
jgi:hypothetical protein